MNAPLSAHRHCQFRSGATWYALPTIAIRHVLPRPEATPLPGGPPALLGLCRLREGFLPVLSAAGLIEAQVPPPLAEPMMLVLDDCGNGRFGLCVGEVLGLCALDSSLNAVHRGPGAWSAVVSGWATHGGRTVHVLDAQRFSAWAARHVEGDGSWSVVEARPV